MINTIFDIFHWIKEDYRDWPFRFGVEVVAWLLSITCSLIMAFTVPHPPLIILYPIWIAGCSMYAWAAYTRKSFGMLANYFLLLSIDSIAMVRLLS